MKKLSALTLSLFLALALCACGDAAAQPSAAPSESPAVSDAAPDAAGSASPAPEVDLTVPVFEYASGVDNSETALTVNGVSLPSELYCYWLSSYCYYIDSNYAYYGMSADFTDQDLADALKGYARDVLVYFTALETLCSENGVALTDTQQADFQATVDQVLADEGLTMEELLWQYGLTEDDFRTVSTASELRDDLMDALVGEPEDTDLARYADDAGVFSCKHILLKTVSADQTDADGNVTATMEEYNAGRLALAEDLLSRLKAADDPEALLDELAEEHSEDGRDTDGHLAAPDGYTFSAEDSLVDGFREATLAVEPGELTGVVETSYGYHVILRLPVDLSSLRDEYRDATLEAILTAETDKAEVTLSDAAQAMDVADFYQRYVDWQTAWSEAHSAG